jgi:hypothetical protein
VVEKVGLEENNSQGEPLLIEDIGQTTSCQTRRLGQT